MLLPEQLLPFLNDQDEPVRHYAAHCVQHLGDKSPPQTENELWRAIDTFGGQTNSACVPECAVFLQALATVRQTDESVTRALDLLVTFKSREEFVSEVLNYLEKLPIELLLQHREKILQAVNKPTGEVIEYRLRLSSLPVDELWERLLNLSIEAENQTRSSDVDNDTAAWITFALCAHPQFAVARALEVLRDPQDRYWLKTWCIDLLGGLHENSAIDLIVQDLIDDDGDFLHPSAKFALGKMDPELVVPKVEAAYDEIDPADESTRMRIPETLGQIQHPLAEAALLRLLARESDIGMITSICDSLIDICTTGGGLEALRQVVIEQRYDGTMSDLMEELVRFARIANYHPPELQQWIDELADPVRKQEKRRKFLARMGVTVEQADAVHKLLKGKSPDELKAMVDRLMQPSEPEEEEEDEPYVPIKPTATIRRETPKIGRNDPCPCGSGKKYKKCCGK